MRTDILERKEEILNWINEGQSKAFMCREFKCKQETLNWWLNEMGIDYKGNKGGRGIKSSPFKRTAKEYAELPNCRSSVLKTKLIEEGLIENKCNECGNKGEWMGKSITLELDHIDGDRFNNKFSNLRILCPNCHSQTPTFRRQKKK